MKISIFRLKNNQKREKLLDNITIIMYNIIINEIYYTKSTEEPKTFIIFSPYTCECGQ